MATSGTATVAVQEDTQRGKITIDSGLPGKVEVKAGAGGVVVYSPASIELRVGPTAVGEPLASIKITPEGVAIKGLKVETKAKVQYSLETLLNKIQMQLLKQDTALAQLS